MQGYLGSKENSPILCTSHFFFVWCNAFRRGKRKNWTTFPQFRIKPFPMGGDVNCFSSALQKRNLQCYRIPTHTIVSIGITQHQLLCSKKKNLGLKQKAIQIWPGMEAINIEITRPFVPCLRISTCPITLFSKKKIIMIIIQESYHSLKPTKKNDIS